MPSTVEQVKSIILKHPGRVSKQQLARELKIGLDYIGLICRELERKGELTFRKGYYLLTISKKAPRQKIILVKKYKPSSRRRQPRTPPIRQLAEKNISAESALLAIPRMTERLINVLEGAGYKTIESLADAPITRFMQETKLELPEAAGLINQARKALNKIGG